MSENKLSRLFSQSPKSSSNNLETHKIHVSVVNIYIFKYISLFWFLYLTKTVLLSQNCHAVQKAWKCDMKWLLLKTEMQIGEPYLSDYKILLLAYIIQMSKKFKLNKEKSFKILTLSNSYVSSWFLVAKIRKKEQKHTYKFLIIKNS